MPLVTVQPDIVSSRVNQRSATGGNAQRIGRKGSHFRIDFVSEPLDPDEARQWGDLRAEDDVVRIPVPQPGLDIGAPGTDCTVTGGPQSGANLTITGLTPHYAIRKDQLLNHYASDGSVRLYRARSEVVADASGEVTVPLETMLTWPAYHSDVIDFTDPKIEGYPTADPSSWLMDGHGYQTLKFSVEEPG